MSDSAPLPLTILSEEEELFRATVREFAETEIAPHVHEMDEAARFKPELIRKFFELGLMGIEVPEQWGDPVDFRKGCFHESYSYMSIDGDTARLQTCLSTWV